MAEDDDAKPAPVQPATTGEFLVANEDAEKSLNPLREVESAAEVYPTGIKLALALASIYFAVFLVALDRTIIATAIPHITDDFHSFDDVGWYNGAFTFTACAFMPFFGRVYTFYSPKWVFLLLVVVFEVGSAVCGAAPTSVAFIWGRAIAGLGAAGLFNGATILMTYAGPLHKRAMYMGFVAAVFGVASIAGPLLGGVFTTKVSWRWCFYINLPIGGLVFVFLLLVLSATPPPQGGLTLRQQIARLDLPGTAVLLPCIVCLLLALQWGGQQYPWSDGRIIALLVLFGVLLLVFAGIQVWQQESATLPPRIMRQRSVLADAWYIFFIGSSFLLPLYYLSIWFQAIKGDSAIRSGVSTIPMLLGMVIGSIGSGIIVMRVGYYKPAMLLSAVLTPIAVGLLTLFTPTTNHSMWIGVQVFFGFGVGCGFQQSNIAVQAILPKKDAPVGISLIFFIQTLGPTIFVAVGQNVLENHLVQRLAGINGLTPQQIINTGATQLRTVFPPADLPRVLQAYNEGIVDVFYVGTAVAACAILGALTIENKSVKRTKPTPEAEPQKAGEEEEAEERRGDKEATEKREAIEETNSADAEGEEVVGKDPAWRADREHTV